MSRFNENYIWLIVFIVLDFNYMDFDGFRDCFVYMSNSLEHREGLYKTG